jgi:hypothetical protein
MICDENRKQREFMFPKHGGRIPEYLKSPGRGGNLDPLASPATAGRDLVESFGRCELPGAVQILELLKTTSCPNSGACDAHQTIVEAEIETF